MRKAIVKKEFRVNWSYQSNTGLEEGSIIITTTTAKRAEALFFKRNPDVRKPWEGKMYGYMVDSVDEITTGLSNEQLKEIIVDLKVRVAMLNVPQGHCPYAYYCINETNERPSCNDISCTQCNKDFWEQYRKIKEAEVKEL